MHKSNRDSRGKPPTPLRSAETAAAVVVMESHSETQGDTAGSSFPSSSSLAATLFTPPSYHSMPDGDKQQQYHRHEKSIIHISDDDGDDDDRKTQNDHVDSGERKLIRFIRHNRRRLIKCGICLVIFIIFNAVLLTVGLTWVAEWALNSFYPPQFNITRHPLLAVQLGPIDGNDIQVRFRVPVPAGMLPVSISLLAPVEISLFICPPKPVVNSSVNFSDAWNATGDPMEGVQVGSSTLDCDRSQQLLIGVARALTDRIDIPASGEAEMSLFLRVESDSTSSADIGAFDHLVNSLLSSAPPLVSNFIIRENTTTADNQTTAAGTTRFLAPFNEAGDIVTDGGLLAGFELPAALTNAEQQQQQFNPTKASNTSRPQLTTIDWLSIDQTAIRVQMTLPCVQVMTLCIRNVRVDKSVLLQGTDLVLPCLHKQIHRHLIAKSLNYHPDQYRMDTVGGMFALIARALVGDPVLLQHTSKLLHIRNLQLYDASVGNPLPMELTALSTTEFQFFSPIHVQPSPSSNTSVNDNNNNNNNTATDDSQVFAGIISRPTTTIRPDSNDNQQPQSQASSASGGRADAGVDGVNIGADTGSMPFSVDVEFRNPSAVEIIGIKGLCINLNYTDQSVVNITIPSVSILARGNSSFRVYGYVRSTVPERVIKSDLPNQLLQVMISQLYRPLPFTLTGCQLHGIPSGEAFSATAASAHDDDNDDNDDDVGSNSSSSSSNNNNNNKTFNNNNNLAIRAVQAMLSRRVVAIGNQYPRLGPLSDPINPQSLAINELFADIPVLGRNRLGDVLQGLQLHLSARLLTARIPVSIFLANPFQCSLYIDSFTIRVFLGTMNETSVGTVVLNQPIHLLPGQRSGVYMNGTMVPLPQPQAVFKINLGIIRQLRATIRFLTASDPDNKPKPFVVSLAFDRIEIRVGRRDLFAENLSQNMLLGIPLIPPWVMSRVGGMNGMMTLFTRGWNMIAPATSAYRNYNVPTTPLFNGSGNETVVDYDSLFQTLTFTSIQQYEPTAAPTPSA